MSDRCPIVTAANEAYWPGVVALYRSFIRHCDVAEFEFHALLQGGDDLEQKARDLGIRYTMNPKIPARSFPCTRNRPEDTAEVHFYRLAVPGIFPERDRCIYIDSDSVILQSLSPLAALEFTQPVAAQRSNSPLSKEIVGRGAMPGYGFISSLMIFNAPKWRSAKCLERCIEAMEKPPVTFITGDQAVLNWVLRDDWYELPPTTQAHAGHMTYTNEPKHMIYTLHFLGTNPWDEIPAHLRPYPPHKLLAREIWRGYYAELC